MQKIFRDWLNDQFARWMSAYGEGFVEIQPVGASGMTKGKTYRLTAGKSRCFLVLRYLGSGERVFLSLAWNSKGSMPSDELNEESRQVMQMTQRLEKVFELSAGWLEPCDLSPEWPHSFEPACTMIQDHHLDRVSRSNSLMTYWGALGLPSDLAKADGFQRQNILTWDSVAGLAPELIAEQDVISYFGDVAFAIEHCLRDCLLPASKRWSGLVESRAE